MSRKLFGTDGVRGLASEYPLDEKGTLSIGKAVGTQFAKEGDKIIVGWDTRESSSEIVRNLAKGLNSVGVNVVLAGVLPTPGLAYLTGLENFVAGIMVTASHNPYQYNGIKVFDSTGGKLSDETEVVLNDLIEKDLPSRGQGGLEEDFELVHKYENFLISTAKGLQLTGVKVAVDSANGAASGIAERVLRRLGADVTAMFDKPNGRNINENCGATATSALRQKVIDDGLSMGIALDGDSDRLVMADHLGREVRGDYLLYLLAVVRQADGVVATVMSNAGFEKALEKKNIKLLRTDVGDRYVLEGLKETGYKLGGEQSGHIIFPLVLATGDGLLAAVQTLRALSTSGKSLADWCDEVELLPQAIVNIPMNDKSKLFEHQVQSYVEEQSSKVADAGGRLLIRPSGTEPLARVMVEADDAAKLAADIANGLRELVG